jgi:hypothetical protein
VLLVGVRATTSPLYQATCYFVTAPLSSRIALSSEACKALLIALANGDWASEIEQLGACTSSLIQQQSSITVYSSEAFVGSYTIAFIGEFKIFKLNPYVTVVLLHNPRYVR